MSDREHRSRFPLGALETDERYVGCLHFRQGTSFDQAARLLHDIATVASHRFSDTIDVGDAEVCREYDFGASACIYDRPVASALETKPGKSGLT